MAGLDPATHLTTSRQAESLARADTLLLSAAPLGGRVKPGHGEWGGVRSFKRLMPDPA
jgi:hypothetical protein